MNKSILTDLGCCDLHFDSQELIHMGYDFKFVVYTA